MKKLLPFLLFMIVSTAFSQNWPVKQLVSDRLNRGETFTTIPAFRFVAIKQLTGRGTYPELQLDASFRSRVMAERPSNLQINIPLSSSQSIMCQLVKASLGNTVFTENNGKEITKVKVPVLYRGIISGEQQKNTVILTVNDDYLSLIATSGNRSIQITQADSSSPQTYRLYNSQQVRFPVVEFSCGTAEMAASQTPNGILLNGVMNHTETVQDKCVNVFVDCFDSLYQWRGSNSQQTINYVYELYNLVATGYINDLVNIQVIGINVWTTADPYRGDNRENALADVATYYKDNFWGNIGIGIDYSISNNGRSGLAGGIGRVKGTSPGSCPAYADGVNNPFCYCDENYIVQVRNFPTGPNVTQQQVYLTMHEMGHLLGAHHTKWCGWQLTPNTTGALDSCGTTEVGCPKGPPPPATGATLMSYCVTDSTTNNYVNYSNGFGLLPGNAIRNYISNNPCIASCLACLDGMLYPINNRKQPVGRLPAGRAIGSTPQRRGSNVSLANSIFHPPLYVVLAAIPGASKSYLSSRYSPSVYPILLQPVDTR